jgi:hypothetical protein
MSFPAGNTVGTAGFRANQTASAGRSHARPGWYEYRSGFRIASLDLRSTNTRASADYGNKSMNRACNAMRGPLIVLIAALSGACWAQSQNGVPTPNVGGSAVGGVASGGSGEPPPANPTVGGPSLSGPLTGGAAVIVPPIGTPPTPGPGVETAPRQQHPLPRDCQKRPDDPRCRDTLPDGPRINGPK